MFYPCTCQSCDNLSFITKMSTHVKLVILQMCDQNWNTYFNSIILAHQLLSLPSLILLLPNCIFSLLPHLRYSPFNPYPPRLCSSPFYLRRLKDDVAQVSLHVDDFKTMEEDQDQTKNPKLDRVVMCFRLLQIKGFAHER